MTDAEREKRASAVSALLRTFGVFTSVSFRFFGRKQTQWSRKDNQWLQMQEGTIQAFFPNEVEVMYLGEDSTMTGTFHIRYDAIDFESIRLDEEAVTFTEFDDRE